MPNVLLPALLLILVSIPVLSVTSHSLERDDAMTLRKHFPRPDSICPDSDECERIGHYAGIAYGDACECCGQVVGDA